MKDTSKQLMFDAECIAKNVSEDYVNGNRLAYLAFMKGMGYLVVENFPGAGHNYYAVLDAMHSIYRTDSSCKADEGFHIAMTTMIRVAMNQSVFQTITDYLFYQLDKERDSTASFKMDKDEIIPNLQKCISERKAEIEEKEPGFTEWLNRTSDVAMREYGFFLYY